MEQTHHLNFFLVSHDLFRHHPNVFHITVNRENRQTVNSKCNHNNRLNGCRRFNNYTLHFVYDPV